MAVQDDLFKNLDFLDSNISNTRACVRGCTAHPEEPKFWKVLKLLCTLHNLSMYWVL